MTGAQAYPAGPIARQMSVAAASQVHHTGPEKMPLPRPGSRVAHRPLSFDQAGNYGTDHDLDCGRLFRPGPLLRALSRAVAEQRAPQAQRGAARVLVLQHSGRRDAARLRHPPPGPRVHPRAGRRGLHLSAQPPAHLPPGARERAGRAARQGVSVLVTGAAGFIGAGLALRLLRDGHAVVGVDNFTPFYDVGLKEARLDRLLWEPRFAFERLDLADRGAVERLFARHAFTHIVHLAAQPGVRYSIDHPQASVTANLVAFGNVIEQARLARPRHFVYASSSSVYDANHQLPFSEHDPVDHPVSLYAATKRANELLAHSYAHVFGLPCTGLRFFTVYGPWMRPDMAVYKFAERITRGLPIQVYNRGDMLRDFTYIDDIVEGVARLLEHPPARDASGKPQEWGPARSSAPFRLFNIGNQQPVELMQLIALLERALGRKARIELLPMQPGDMHATAADISDLHAEVGFAPSTPLETGIERFSEWFKDYTRRTRRVSEPEARRVPSPA